MIIKMSELNIRHTPVFSKNWNAFNDSNIRYIVNQGSSRSSKSFSIAQLIVVYCLTNSNKMVSVVRRNLSTLRTTAMQDILTVLKDLNVYEIKNHNRTNNEYSFNNGTKIMFIGSESSQKLRGKKHDIVYIDESNELNFEEFMQLDIRCSGSGKIFLAFNPSDNFHWIYDLSEQKDSILIKSTYKDNPFIEKKQREVIENLKNVDESYYRIYALGEKGVSRTTIFTHYREYFEHELPATEDTLYSIDFGFNHETAMCQTWFIDNKAYVKELIYKSGLTTSDLITLMNFIGIPKGKTIVCDGARPEAIEDLRRHGYGAIAAIKDVKAGIDSVKSVELFIHKESTNLFKELSSYKWATAGDMILDEPVKLWDHLIDAMRYSIHYHKIKTGKQKFNKNAAKIYRPGNNDNW
jgi:phage terminase large subunit